MPADPTRFEDAEAIGDVIAEHGAKLDALGGLDSDAEPPKKGRGWGKWVAVGAGIVLAGYLAKDCLVDFAHSWNHKEPAAQVSTLPTYNWFQVTSAVKTGERAVTLRATDIPDGRVTGGRYPVSQSDVKTTLTPERWSVVVDDAWGNFLVGSTSRLADAAEKTGSDGIGSYWKRQEAWDAYRRLKGTDIQDMSVEQSDVGSSFSKDDWKETLAGARNRRGTTFFSDTSGGASGKDKTETAEKIRKYWDAEAQKVVTPAQYALEIRDTNDPNSIRGFLILETSEGNPVYVRVNTKAGGEFVYPIKPQRRIGFEPETWSLPEASLEWLTTPTLADDQMDFDGAYLGRLGYQRSRARGVYGRDVLGNKANAEKGRRGTDFEAKH